MEEFREEMRNGLVCSIDWLSFTITDPNMTLHNVLDLFGLDRSDFHECDKGAMGYKRMILFGGSNIRVLFEGNDNMGVHFDVSGSAMGDFLEIYKRGISELTPWDTLAIDMDVQIMSHMMARIQDHGHVTRLDLAIDDTGEAFYKLRELEAILLEGNYVSKFRTWRAVREHMMSGDVIGDTIYLGSRSSSVMLRVYDKRLEQTAKGNAPVDPDAGDWVRWEFELKNERAEIAAQHIIDGKAVGELCVGILQNYFRVIVQDDSNKSRCSMEEKWQRFIDGIGALRLFIRHEGKTLDDKKEWLLRQVAPTLTGVIIANYGDASFIFNHMETHAGRMKSDLRELVDKAHPGWQRCFDPLRE